MSDRDQPRADLPETASEGEGRFASRVPKQPRDPAATLTLAMWVYIAVNLIFALPLLFFPQSFFDLIGLDDPVAGDLGGLRWVGAVLLAWAVSGLVVLARPEGRAIFVTTGAFQLSLAALAFLYSWSVDEYKWSTWYQVVSTAILVVGSLYLWWARFRGRALFRSRAENT